MKDVKLTDLSLCDDKYRADITISDGEWHLDTLYGFSLLSGDWYCLEKPEYRSDFPAIAVALSEHTINYLADECCEECKKYDDMDLRFKVKEYWMSKGVRK